MRRPLATALLTLLLTPLATLAAALDFTLDRLDGEPVSLSDYRGQWVVLNYWATWCPPCIEEMPELSLFHEIHADDEAVVLGINLEQADDERLRRFVSDYSINFPILRVGNINNPPLGPIPGLPTTLLISPAGELAARRVGRVTQASLERMIEQAKSER